MGLDLRLLGRFDEAIEACRAGLAIDPTSSWGHLWLATALRGKKQYRESLAAFEMAKKFDPNNPFLARDIGDMIQAQKGLDGLIAYWRREMELSPKDWRSPLYLGIALARKGQLDPGLACLEKSISLTPTDPSELADGYSDFGYILIDRGRLDEAIVWFRKSIEIQPKYKSFGVGSAYTGLGDALVRQAKLDPAIAAFRKSIEIAPGFVKGYRQLITALLQKGQSQEAIIWLGKLTALDPTHPYDRNNLAWYLVTLNPEQLRKPALAVKLARGTVDLQPEVGNHWNTLGVAHYRAGDWKAAIAALQRSMELREGGDSCDWFFLAMAHEKLGDKEQARKWHDQAIQWMEKNKVEDQELSAFRAEAAQLLGVEGRKK